MRITAGRHALIAAAVAVACVLSGCVNVDGTTLYRFDGRLVDAATGRPLAGRRVWVDVGRPGTLAEAGGKAVTTAADGTFDAPCGTGLDHDGRDRSPPPPGTVYLSTADADGTHATATTAATSGGADLGTVAVTRP